MKVFRLLAFFLLMIISTLSIAQNKFDGLWTGTIAAGGIEMQIDFEIIETEQKVLMSVPIQKPRRYRIFYISYKRGYTYDYVHGIQGKI